MPPENWSDYIWNHRIFTYNLNKTITLKPLTTLLKAVRRYELTGSPDWEISGVTFDSRKIEASTVPGATQIYVAQRGTLTDGHLYIPQAIEKGCHVIVGETMPENLPAEVTFVQVPDSTVALGLMASAFYDHPSRKLKLVGITGTNGKTTTVTLLHRLFTGMGYTTGMLSTIVNRIGEEEVPATHTTPDAVELNGLLHRMVEAGCQYCFMEVSSHAVCQHRIAGLQFAGAIFSNITHDHLDFHKTFANYIAAKKAFFDALPKTAFALTNVDDKNGMVMVQNSKAKVSTYSLLTAATFKGKVLDDSFRGLQMRINDHEVYFRLCGKFNAYNLLAIYGAAVLLGAPEEDVLVGMSTLNSAPGRFQLVYRKDGATAIVDYAHTPDALQNVLSTIREISKSGTEVITVVGCGGDRDKTKRPEMAEIACKLSSRVILTSDNPRTEEPAAILNDMVAGVPAGKKNNVLVIENRREAIRTGCMLLPADGVLLVAGKGHENYQEINHVKHHFDDTEEIRNAFNDN
ncbi:MAG: UDP-N-acetylmuramoyl-L-alanyl-D-glutamate--2,6-diaminopimelate ligase [Bacteroidales bacterium]|nr:UDP-N-acetylmuramoyl-L-alanyl-D-glutamate--2,6-diaminopimelate ligase [Bacteroidales bacterium]